MSYDTMDTTFPPSIVQDRPDLFAEQAEYAASRCKDKKLNKPAQLRRFYDELVMWHDKVFAAKTAEERLERFKKVEPFIQMMRAKASYALGRALITRDFFDLLNDLIKQIQSPESLKRAKLFFEAFIGYMKFYEKAKNSEQ